VTTLLRPGVIRIGVAIDADGRTTEVRIRSDRPIGVARLFVGRPAADVPALSRSLFSLCGFAHGVAARRAIAAAQGAPGSTRRAETVGLAAERLAESLRASLLGWPGIAEEPTRFGAPLREVVGAARTLMTDPAPAEAETAAARLEAAVAALGVAQSQSPTPSPGSVFADIQAEAAVEDFLCPASLDALAPADDAAVICALRAGRETFASAPALPGRVIETGAFARHGVAGRAPSLAARLRARFEDIGEALSLLRDGADAGATGSTGLGEGFAAVETARGRLYHWTRLDSDGRIGDYQILAPTEWNFHPAGPFVAALTGATLGSGDAARRRIGRAAALFDPCVAFEVELSGDA
jgi:uptake hydrogenase large subunit